MPRSTLQIAAKVTTVNATLALDEDPRIEIVPIEKIGGAPNDEQKRFRESWLRSLQK